MNEQQVFDTYERITRTLIARGLTVSTMESCTAGALASLITDTEGSSAALRGAFVTYCNEAKVLQGVPAATIAQHGVYSRETAAAMAHACRAAYRADLGVGVTGTMGNVDPHNQDSTPGQAYFALETDAGVQCHELQVPAQPTRRAYKLWVAQAIGERILELLDNRPDDTSGTAR